MYYEKQMKYICKAVQNNGIRNVQKKRFHTQRAKEVLKRITYKKNSTKPDGFYARMLTQNCSQLTWFCHYFMTTLFLFLLNSYSSYTKHAFFVVNKYTQTMVGAE